MSMISDEEINLFIKEARLRLPEDKDDLNKMKGASNKMKGNRRFGESNG